MIGFRQKKSRCRSLQVAAQRALLFNPIALPKGIEPSADPVLLFRPAAYAVSFGQRAQ
jgi:catalase